jgi:succinyl-diaminopimelate desuccinylase
MSHAELFEKIDSMKERAAELLSRLIRINTAVPPGDNYAAMCDFLSERFSTLDFESELVEVPVERLSHLQLELQGPRLNLVSVGFPGKPPISIYAHFDTVPADGDWSCDPFGGEVKNDRVYGRGAVDMKGSIAALIIALEAIEELGLEPLFEVHALLTSDEEIGGSPGIFHLAEGGYILGSLLWLEGGAQLPISILAGAGILQFIITVRGKSCHSGANYLGVNAIEQAVPLLEELLALKRRVEAFRSRIPAFPQPEHPVDRMTPMFNLNIIRGGEKANVVPDICRLVIDRRFLPDEREEKVRVEVREALERGRKRSKALSVEVEEILVYPPFEIDAHSPGAQKARRALSLIHGFEPENFLFGGFSASSDISYVQRVLPDLEIIGMGPFSLETIGKAHAVDECIPLSDLLSLAKQIAYFLSCEE